MNFWIPLGVSGLLLFVTIAIFATKAFFPYHRIIALSVYAIGWIPFLYSLYVRKKFFLQYKDYFTSFFTAFWIHILFALTMLFVIYVFLVIFPPTKSPFIGLEKEEILTHLKEDETIIKYLDQKLKNLTLEAEEENLNTVDLTLATSKERERLYILWTSYLETLIELDLLKKRYETFYQINALSEKEAHALAFKNGYTALLAQHYYALQLEKIFTNKDIIAFFNEAIPEQGVPENSFSLITSKLTDSDEVIRVNTGRVYNKTLEDSAPELSKLIRVYLEGMDDSLREYTHLVAKKPLDFLEKKSFDLWFPLQKNVAVQISYIKTTKRDYHITFDQIREFADTLKPGDILLERREWHATNVGIPGFWTHSALYIGTLDYLDSYFSGLDLLNGKTFSQYIKEQYPEAYAKMTTEDKHGFPFSVIESKRPGVIFMSLEASANADSLAILRVQNTSKADHFRIVTQAISHLGKPYDFDFNFITDNALVCSELVYKAYRNIPQFKIVPEEFNGRPIVSPNQFAITFSEQFEKENAEFDLVLFLDGNEKDKKAYRKDAVAFAETWNRPKWHIANDFVNFE